MDNDFQTGEFYTADGEVFHCEYKLVDHSPLVIGLGVEMVKSLTSVSCACITSGINFTEIKGEVVLSLLDSLAVNQKTILVVSQEFLQVAAYAITRDDRVHGCVVIDVMELEMTDELKFLSEVKLSTLCLTSERSSQVETYFKSLKGKKSFQVVNVEGDRVSVLQDWLGSHFRIKA